MIIKTLAQNLGLDQAKVQAAVELLDQGNTLPFIARYRKELTGGLKDTELRQIETLLKRLRSLEQRRAEVYEAIDSQGLMTLDLTRAIRQAQTLSELEDLYRPFKKRRNTKGQKAVEMGLEPLALKILTQADGLDLGREAEAFLRPDLGLDQVDQVLQGAGYIIAEKISDQAEVRSRVREQIQKYGRVRVKADDPEGLYENYRDYCQAVSNLAPHQILALNRGAKQGLLKLSIDLDQDRVLDQVYYLAGARKQNQAGEFVREAAKDAYKRLIFPALENEAFSNLFDRAADQSMQVFALNLKPLLLQPPLTGQVVLGLDPAYRTGCKLAVVDQRGKLLATEIIYPTPPQNKLVESEQVLLDLVKRYGVELIAIGNGTASKESETFVANLIHKEGLKLKYAVVNEAGASVYSASELAGQEFPDLDVSLRSAVSIARRLQDPLAELVKIEPRSIGVGQYQHDLPQKELSRVLGGVVEDCVNQVGVDLNTASPALLAYVAGIGPVLAQNIVDYRDREGGFKSRKELLKVNKLGPKTFEQAAGFLRVFTGDNFLDRTAVHPESYRAAGRILDLCEYGPKARADLAFNDLDQRVEKYGWDRLAQELGLGLPTLRDIVTELKKPGRDPRETAQGIQLRSDLLSLEDLKPGQVLEGTVRNVVDFGAFIDIGVHQDGLVHISKLSRSFVKHPSDLVQVGDIVRVRVEEVDTRRKRISLSMLDLD